MSSSSHFDSRGLLVGDGTCSGPPPQVGVLEASSVESSSTSNGQAAPGGGGGPGSPELEGVAGSAAAAQAAAAAAAALFNENAINAIAGFIKDVDSAHNSHLVTTIQQTSAGNGGGGGGGGVTSTSTAADSSLFDVAVAAGADGTVDSTTTTATTTSSSSSSLNPNISPNSSSSSSQQQQQQLSLSSAYAAFGYSGQQQQQHLSQQQQSNSSSVLTYGHLSPEEHHQHHHNHHHHFSPATLLHMDGQQQQQQQQHQSLLLPPLSSPTMSQIDSYFNGTSGAGGGQQSSAGKIIASPLSLQGHHQMHPHHHQQASHHQANFIVNDVIAGGGGVSGGHCGGLLTAEETNCFLNDLNHHHHDQEEEEEESEHIVGSFVPVVPEEEAVLQENRLPVHNVISDVPVLTRARASLPVEYLYLAESLTDSGDGGGAARRLAVFARKSIPSKTQFGPIEGVIASFKNELYSLSQIAYSAKDYLHIFISEAVLLNQEDENNSNWTRFVRPATSPQEQNIELITKEFADTNELKFFLYTTRNILPSEELKVWYSDDYCARFRIRTQAEMAAAIVAAQASQLQLQQTQLSPAAIPVTPGSSAASASSALSDLSTADIGHKLRNKIAKTQPEVQLGGVGGSGGVMLHHQQSKANIDEQGLELEEEENEINNHLQTLMAVDAHSLVTGGQNSHQLHLHFGDNGLDLSGSADQLIQTSVAASSSLASVTGVIMGQQQQQQPEMNGSKTVGGGKTQYKCDICERVFPRQYSLRRHLVMHSGKITFKKSVW